MNPISGLTLKEEATVVSSEVLMVLTLYYNQKMTENIHLFDCLLDSRLLSITFCENLVCFTS